MDFHGVGITDVPFAVERPVVTPHFITPCVSQNSTILDMTPASIIWLLIERGDSRGYEEQKA